MNYRFKQVIEEEMTRLETLKVADSSPLHSDSTWTKVYRKSDWVKRLNMSSNPRRFLAWMFGGFSFNM